MGGLLAGGNVDRAFVAMPAWEQVGPIAWGQFSRQADLGNGLLLYPLEAFGTTLLALAAAISFHFDGVASRKIAPPRYSAALLCIAGSSSRSKPRRSCLVSETPTNRQPYGPAALVHSRLSDSRVPADPLLPQ